MTRTLSAHTLRDGSGANGATGADKLSSSVERP